MLPRRPHLRPSLVILPPGHNLGMVRVRIRRGMYGWRGRVVDRRMHATETSFGSQDGKQATERRGAAEEVEEGVAALLQVSSEG